MMNFYSFDYFCLQFLKFFYSWFLLCLNNCFFNTIAFLSRWSFIIFFKLKFLRNNYYYINVIERSIINLYKSLRYFSSYLFYLLKMSHIIIKWVFLLFLIGICFSIPYRVKFNKPIVESMEYDMVPERTYQMSNLEASKTSNILWPLPKSIESNPNATTLVISPCKINYKISSPSSIVVQEIINIYLTQVFKCAQQPMSNITLAVVVKNVDQMIATNITQ